MKRQGYKVYIRVDDAGCVTAIQSDAFLHDTEGWQLLDEGMGDRFHHAQNNYLPLPLTDDRGAYRYRLDGGVLVQRTEADMALDDVVVEQPVSMENRVRQLEEALDLLMSGVTE